MPVWAGGRNLSLPPVMGCGDQNVFVIGRGASEMPEDFCPVGRVRDRSTPTTLPNHRSLGAMARERMLRSKAVNVLPGPPNLKMERSTSYSVRGDWSGKPGVYGER